MIQSRLMDAGEAVSIPVTTITGAKPGPALALIAGNHGYEYPPILALQRLRAHLDPARLAGAVIMVHVANMPSFLGRTVYFSPADGKNLNRVYPGRVDGTVSERIAFAITTQVIERADYVLDLHCGDGNESLRPYVYQAVTADERMNAETARLALAFGIDHILLDRNRPTDPAASLYCSTTAITRGKPALTIESGQLGMTDEESVARIVAGVHGVMRELKMMDEGPVPVAKPLYIEPAVVLTSPETGLLYPLVGRDQKVAEGAPIARITDFFGEEIAVVRTPIGGVVLYVVATPPIVKGQPVGCVGAWTG
ncbi:MAG TPA: M14 family metallopeptidase [Verrucomicrobiae bacterium]|nr:M14 family metallopeptidase [Verrucomicrobiae bacterium]